MDMRFFHFYAALIVIQNIVGRHYLCTGRSGRALRAKKLFISHIPGKHKKCHHCYHHCQRDTVGVYRSRRKHQSDSTNVKSSLESPIVGFKISDGFGKNKFPYSCDSTPEFFHLNSGNKKLSFKLRKELLLCRNKSLLNALLCLHYLPDSSAAYLKSVLHNFSLSDFHIKENILYHLTLKWLYTRDESEGQGTHRIEEDVLSQIDRNKFKFDLIHSRVLKRLVKNKREEQGERPLRNGNNLVQTEWKGLRLASFPENKIIDVYLKMKKKLNILSVSIKQERNVYNVYKKIKRNITFYDIYDRFIILNYFYSHAKYRLFFLFFKKYVYTYLNKDNFFVINLVNKLSEENALRNNMMKINFMHYILHNEIGFDTYRDMYKLHSQPVSTYSFVDSYMKDHVYFRRKKRISISYSEEKKKAYKSYGIYFLFYINMLNCFLEKGNYYFSEQFLKQFYLYYSEKKYILHDHKWFFFLITLSNSMKICYIKEKYHIINSENKVCKEEEKNSVMNYVKIYNEDIFSDTKNFSITHFSHLNTQIGSYIQENIVNLRIAHKGVDPFKTYSLLLILQYTFLLGINLDNADFVNTRAPNHFNNAVTNEGESNSYYAGAKKGKEEKGVLNPDTGLSAYMQKRFLLNHYKKDSAQLNAASTRGNVGYPRMCDFSKKKEANAKAIEEAIEEASEGASIGQTTEAKAGTELAIDGTTVSENKEKQFSLIVNGYEAILKGNFYGTVSDSILMYNNTFDELHFFMHSYLTNMEERSLNGGTEATHELAANIRCILPACNINISFLFRLLSALDLHNCREEALSILYENKKLLRNVLPNIRKMILRIFKSRIVLDKEKKITALFEHAKLRYQAVYCTYRSILHSCNKEHVKRLVKNLINGDEKNVDMLLRIFRKPVLALNMRQIFFIFYFLNNFNLHKEIIQLFRHITKCTHFKKVFYKSILKKKKKKHKKCRSRSNYSEAHSLCKKILFIYYNSRMHFDNSFYLTEGGKKGMKNWVQKHFFFYHNPLDIFKYLIKTYKGKKKIYIKKKEPISAKRVETIEGEIHKIEDSHFFDKKNVKKLKESKTFKRFFVEEVYTHISEKEYTLIFNGLMKYLRKKKTTVDNGDIINEEEKKKKAQKKKNLHAQYIYLYFYLTLQCYISGHKMSNINFLVLLKTCLLMNDMNTFENILLTNQNKAFKNYILISSLLNNHLLHYEKVAHILRSHLAVPIDMYIIHKDQLTIFNLNYFQEVKTIYKFVKCKMENKIIFFIDYRKIFISLVNLEPFFTLPFLKNDKFVKFLNDHDVTLNEENFLSISEFVIFYGKCMNKKKKILDFFSDNYKNFYIHKNKSIKDAFIVSLKN
ncbi:conserved Plasmodium protein, unknown function [Plasmodium ovale]|uniref:Uncharacterized protein n=1 Tax=Plasmodium ovale TaxID=36330 RepID=A0A1C3KUB1_PLAOA|nr:conserved Plasmodium protein, unknown function [Plasmodium ovale]